MVKKRLFFLVILHVALTLVAFSNAQDGPEDGGLDGDGSPIIEAGPFEEEPQQEPELTEEPLQGPLLIEDPPAEATEEPLQGPLLIEDPPAEATEEPVLIVDPPPPEEPLVDTYTVKITKKRRVKKKTTPAPEIPCEELPEIIKAKEDAINSGFEGYTPDQCQFIIVDRSVCQWQYVCGQTVTEAPTEPPTTEEPDSSEESLEAEECEPKKKFKFENCFLKIRGLIKKKKPSRC